MLLDLGPSAGQINGILLLALTIALVCLNLQSVVNSAAVSTMDVKIHLLFLMRLGLTNENGY